jgi:hypothetical protein
MSKATSSFRPRKKDSTSTSLSSSHGGPYNQTLRLLSIIFLILLLFLSTAALILKANTFSFIEMNREMGFFLEMPEFEGDPEKQPLVAALPLRLYRVSEKIILIMSGLNILLSMGPWTYCHKLENSSASMGLPRLTKPRLILTR